ncbi:MAG: GLPGLI family protein [Lewinellaceae bacterium]|nr:GLPGLI family protein [Lewinellaceae bacterium]
MKSIVTTITLLLAAFSLWAQPTTGKITYEQRINMHRDLPPEREEMKQFLPEFQVSQIELHFNTAASLWKQVEEAPEVDVSQETEGGGRMQIRMRNVSPIIYRDLASNRMVEATQFMDKPFLIDDGSPNFAWKITGEQKMIAGYPCMAAVAQDSTVRGPRTIKAFFTPGIPVSAGPISFGGLPGMILLVDVNDGRQVITATQVNLDPAAVGEIAEPTKGKKVTRAEYDKIMEERLKEMGGGGNMIRIIRN